MAVRHVDAVRDAMAVGDDQGRPGVGLGLEECLQGMLVLRAHRDAGDIDVAISHRHETEILLRAALAAGSEFRHRAARVAFEHWPPVFE